MIADPHNMEIQFDQQVARLGDGSAILLWLRAGTSWAPQGTHLTIRSGLAPKVAEQAHACGQQWAAYLGQVFAAPGDVPKLTAMALLKGAGRGHERLETDWDVGDPSAFVVDYPACATAIARQADTSSARECVLDGILRQRAAWAAPDPRAAAQRIQARLLSAMQPDKIAICITPGTPITAFTAFALGKEADFRAADSPTRALTGLVVRRDENGILQLQFGRYSGPSRL